MQNTLAVRRFGLHQERKKAERDARDDGQKGGGEEKTVGPDKKQQGATAVVDEKRDKKDRKEHDRGHQTEASEANGGGKQKKEGGATVSKATNTDEDRKPTLRVLAYSDSDSDVEDHFESVTALLPGVEKLNIKADTGNKKVEKNKVAEDEFTEHHKAAGTVAAGRLLSKISTGLFGTVLTPGVVLGGAVLGGVERRVGRRGVWGVEMGAVGVFVVRTLVALMRGRRLPIIGSASVEGGGRPTLLSKFELVSDSAVKASLVFEGFKWLVRHKREGNRENASSLRRLGSRIQLDRLASTERVELPENPDDVTSLNAYAAAYNPELQEMRRILEACEVVLPSRFDDGNEELFRFAKACGLLGVESVEGRASCIERAIRRVIQTVEAEAKEFSVDKRMPENRLARWERVVSWRGITPAGRPVLVVRLGRALQLTQTTTSRLEKFVHAVKTQVDVGIREKMGRSKFGTMVVVVDCGEITAWEALTNSRQLSGLAKSLAVWFTSHYPERLERVYLVDSSMMVNRMFVSPVVSMLDASTKEKIVSTTNSDESLPVTLASLQKARSIAGELSSVISDATTIGEPVEQNGDGDGEQDEREKEGAVTEDSTSTPSDVRHDAPQFSSTPSTFTSGEEFHTPFVKMPRAQGDEDHSVLKKAANDGEHRDLGSHYLQPTPMSEASIRGKLFGSESVDSLDLQFHLLQYPWSGLDLLLVFFLRPLRTFLSPGHRDRGSHKPAISPTMRSSGLGFSRESSFDSLGSPRINPIKGGLLELPLRSRLSSGTSPVSTSSVTGLTSTSQTRTKVASPTKPSLRRESSLAEEYVLSREVSNVLGSYPLPRQSSVSWAETLVNVREIDEMAAIEWNDDGLKDIMNVYLVCLLLTLRIVAGCFGP